MERGTRVTSWIHGKVQGVTSQISERRWPKRVVVLLTHRFLNPHRLLVETWCFTPSSKFNLLFVSPFVQLKSLILLLVLCPKRRGSQLTNRSQGGRLIISCDKVRFCWRSENVGDWTMWFKTNSRKMVKNRWPDLIQVIEHLHAFVWIFKVLI